MELPKDCNYYEIIFMNADLYSLGQSAFAKLLANMTATNYKSFEKQYKEYIIDDIIVQNYNNQETKILRLTPKDIIDRITYRIIGYQKSKLTALNHPSTTYIYNTLYIKKLTFRISNRIYINFEIALDKDEEKTYKVYINYNHDTNVDMSVITEQLKGLMHLFLE